MNDNNLVCIMYVLFFNTIGFLIQVSDKNHGVNLDDVMDAFNALALTGDAKQYAGLVSLCSLDVWQSLYAY